MLLTHSKRSRIKDGTRWRVEDSDIIITCAYDYMGRRFEKKASTNDSVTLDGDVDQSPRGLGRRTANGVAVSQPIQWSSEVFDFDLGLVCYNNRYYNPLEGRWTRRDPIGIEGGINLYSYTENRPLDRVDILGNSFGCFGKCRKKCGGAKCCRTGDNGCCEKRTLKQNADFDNTPNGCGSNDWISSKVPNLIFKPACDAHDICYGTCGSSKARCDMEFKLNMYALCEKADADWFKANRYDLIGDIVHASGAYVYYCKKIADTYYNAVDSLAGDYIFSITQDEACLWEKC